ncbi:MAG: hypothetical protein AAF658_07175 [Myxococcota bacterium]
MSDDQPEIDEEGFLYDGQRITVLRGQHPNNFYSAHAFFLAQRFAYGETNSILRDEHDYPMLGLLRVPRGEEHNHESVLAQIEWVLARILRGLINRALRMSNEPLRIALSGFGPFEDQSGVQIPHNVTGEFAAAHGRLRSTLRTALPDKLAPVDANEKSQELASPHDLAVPVRVYDPDFRLGRPVTVFARVLSVDTRTLSNDRAMGLLGMLEFYRPHIYIGLGVRKRGAPEFVIEEVSDNSGLGRTPDLHHAPDAPATTGHPLNRAAARAFAQGLQELGGMSHD